MCLPTTGSLSHQALLMPGSERKSARLRGSGDVLCKMFDDYREVASAVRDHPASLTLAQAADKATDLDEITSHHPPSFLLLLALQVIFQHTARRQSVLPPCLWLNNTSGTLLGEADLPVLPSRILMFLAPFQVDNMTCQGITWRRT